MVTSIFNALSVSGLAPVLSNPGTQNPIVSDLESAGYRVNASTEPWPPALRRWNTVYRKVASFLLSVAASRHRVANVLFCSNGPLFNLNAVGLAAEQYFGEDLVLGQLDPSVGAGTVTAYRSQLTQRGTPWNLLVLADPGPGEFAPLIDQGRVEQAAREAGFRPVAQFRLPDGRRGKILWRDRGLPS